MRVSQMLLLVFAISVPGIGEWFSRLPGTVMETNVLNVACSTHQSSSMNHDWTLSCIGDSSYPPLYEINLNGLEDSLDLLLEYFDVGQDFDLQF